jgi:hypothetical protein
MPGQRATVLQLPSVPLGAPEEEQAGKETARPAPDLMYT